MYGKINYSIIIPHKNTLELLIRCLDSIPRRKDVQIIVIDDSSDKEIVDFEKLNIINSEYIKIVLLNEDKGAGYARNVGLTYSIGKWLVFADSDDYFINGFFDYFDEYNDSGHDLIYFGIHGIDAETKEENHIGKFYNDLLLEAIKKNQYEKYLYTNWNPWGKLISRKMVVENDIRFDETYAANDKMFSLKAAYYAKNILLVKNKIYVYELRNNSIIKQQSLSLNLDRFLVDINSNNFLRSIGKKNYRVKILKRLVRLINIKDMAYFYKGIKHLKGNYIYLFTEIILYIIHVPCKIIKKLNLSK
ncbi:MAG: glycosyltransferase family 2 protein [Treponema sp.]|nr:glycosyltransferase family 2 protein [Treponema sp.]